MLEQRSLDMDRKTGKRSREDDANLRGQESEIYNSMGAAAKRQQLSEGAGVMTLEVKKSPAMSGVSPTQNSKPRGVTAGFNSDIKSSDEDSDGEDESQEEEDYDDDDDDNDEDYEASRKTRKIKSKPKTSIPLSSLSTPPTCKKTQQSSRPTKELQVASPSSNQPLTATVRYPKSMSREQLVAELCARDSRIATLTAEVQRLSSSVLALPQVKNADIFQKCAAKGAAGKAKLSGGGADSASVAAAVDKLKVIAHKGISAQMIWKPSCRGGGARWAWESLCDEETFLALRASAGAAVRSNRCRVEVEALEELLGRGRLVRGIRYGHLEVTGTHVLVAYADGQLKISGSYGLPARRGESLDL